MLSCFTWGSSRVRGKANSPSGDEEQAMRNTQVRSRESGRASSVPFYLSFFSPPVPLLTGTCFPESVQRHPTGVCNVNRQCFARHRQALISGNTTSTALPHSRLLAGALGRGPVTLVDRVEEQLQSGTKDRLVLHAPPQIAPSLTSLYICTCQGVLVLLTRWFDSYPSTELIQAPPPKSPENLC